MDLGHFGGHLGGFGAPKPAPETGREGKGPKRDPCIPSNTFTHFQSEGAISATETEPGGNLFRDRFWDRFLEPVYVDLC